MLQKSNIFALRKTDNLTFRKNSKLTIFIKTIVKHCAE